MAQSASQRTATQELPLLAKNLDQHINTHLNTDFSSSFPAGHKRHKRTRYDEQIKVANPLDLYPLQQWVPAKSESDEIINPYCFGPEIPVLLEATLVNAVQAEELPESLCWTQPTFGSDLLDIPSWSDTSSPRGDAFNVQTTSPYIDKDYLSMDDSKGDHASDVEKRGNRRRKRSISPDHSEANDKEQRRMDHIVQNLKKFEYQQRMYGKQQLKAIKDGIA
ncbi:hypothetical protein V8C42DRAFT_357469 [Trichoderma barbatum]